MGMGGRNQALSGSFLKKRTKKLFVLRAVAIPSPQPAGIKVFLLLFVHKKKCLCRTAEKLPHHPKSGMPACAGMTGWGG
jgi:hypothetical protein